jgi:hypothetical protein
LGRGCSRRRTAKQLGREFHSAITDFVHHPGKAIDHVKYHRGGFGSIGLRNNKTYGDVPAIREFL